MVSSSLSKVGMHVDLRVQVMRPEALHRLADRLAENGFNTLLVEWEASFPFQKHPLISNRYAYSVKQIKDFIAYCKGLGIEVIALQQCFGHVEYILQHERYKALRENESDLCQLCPCKGDAALALFEEIFTELIALHPSPYLHIGGDETYLLGSCEACQKVVKKEGASALYVDYFKRVAQLVVKLGKRPLIWADMLLKHPDQAAAMPASSIFVDWNYGWEIDRFGDPENLRKSNFEFWGAPALRSSPDNHSLVCWPRHFNNLRDYIPYVQDNGFTGLILTSWSTSGVYGYRWEDRGSALEILPVRRVYPLSGTLILLDAFKVAVRSAEQGQLFDIEAFVRGYAQSRFGLDARAGGVLWQALQLGDNVQDAAVDVPRAAAQGRKAALALAKLSARKNKKEFAQLQLVTDLYAFRSALRLLELEVNDEGFTARDLPAMLKKLEKMRTEAKELDRRFIALNKSDFYSDELKEECAYRNNRLENLYLRLKRRG